MIVFLAGNSKLVAWLMSALFYADLVTGQLPFKGRLYFASGASFAKPANGISPWLNIPGKENDPSTDIRVTGGAVTGIDPKQRPAKPEHEFTTGPGQPEMQAFSSVNSNNMVDLFTGDFSYNIPLMDVGGYPINLSYRGGITMDQEASWVGLGWNVNPGTITRNMRGLPDDFNGANDSVKKIMHIRDNKTFGVSAGADMEIVGVQHLEKANKDTSIPSGITVGASLGITANNYRGWGIEYSLNASINSGKGAKGPLSGGLGITNSSQEGLTVSPSLSMRLWQYAGNENAGGSSGSFSISAPYNSRTGLKALQLSTGVTQYEKDTKNQKSVSSGYSSVISFASAGYTPTITIPFTSRQFSFTGKVGLEEKVSHPSFFISGYVSNQRIEDKDTLLALPSYGYLYYRNGALNRGALLDFNREKELPYRDKPATPHIAIPQYTYDAFSITGEGTGGMFRAYRGDIGFIYDHFIRTKDESDKLSIDVGIADLVHAGVDLNINRAFTQNGPWLNQNTLRQVIDFRKDSLDFESVYFRNPGEKSINSKQFYDNIGGDDVVTVGLYQSNISSSDIRTTNNLIRYKGKRAVGTIPLNSTTATKQSRDKRTQVISYLTAKEADVAGLSKYIDNYAVNHFNPAICGQANFDSVEGSGTGLPAQYFKTLNLTGISYSRIDKRIDSNWHKGGPTITGVSNFPKDKFSIRWTGRFIAPETGRYRFYPRSDDGLLLWINDSLFVKHWDDHPAEAGDKDSFAVNLVANQLYTIRMEYYENGANASVSLQWLPPGGTKVVVPYTVLYPPAIDTFRIDDNLVKEKRVNAFRKSNHISEITVLNNDGRRYIYGIPVYNLVQKEATFAVDGKNGGNTTTGLVRYNHGVDNSAGNRQGKDWYYNSEQVPAYAHSFLLTGILSADYSDVTGNGISEDDIGDAVKFNYSKVCGIGNPYKWRAPGIQDSATFNEGLKTDSRDDKGNYVYGEKELWYLHSIESKTMIATFTLEDRLDLPAIDEEGVKIHDGSARRLKEINLYSKSDFAKKGTAARPVKTVHFEYGYDLCKGVNKPLNDTGKLTLKKVWFTYNGNDKSKQNPYTFSYNSKNPTYNIKSYDRWGNFKDPLQNAGSTTGNVINNAEYPWSLQDSALAAANAAAWTLDSIHLPSGGSIKINFESDDYAFVQNKRAMQMFKIVGFDTTPNSTHYVPKLYSSKKDNLYVYIKVPKAVSTVQDVYRYYLTDVEKLYFKLFVRMPERPLESGSEYVSCYADLATGSSYGLVNSTTIWVKMSGISFKGDEPGIFSPLAKAAIQYLRLNIPAKAYPGSETDDDVNLADAIRVLASLGDNIKDAVQGFDTRARDNKWGSNADTSRCYVRLNNPFYKKYGGGQRVRRVTIYDNWNKMTHQRAALYGQDFTYTVKKEINGVQTLISSGVASYEPGLGGEENPFHVPIEYVEKIAPLGPVTLGYSEEPLGESFFPSAGVGYGNIRVRNINYQNKKSANGYDETKFYTAYDFPTYTDRSLLDDDTKKRFKPALANFLRINARHYITLSQGFKIELNDMHGKLRSKASYPETDPDHYISYTENIYRVENRDLDFKRLSNTVMAMKPDGSIDTAALIGKDVELMMDMREQLSITNGYNVQLNTEMFSVPVIPPFFLIPVFLNLAQREENIYRSAATMKIIQRYGILDSAIQVDKGSKIVTKDLLYDSETGDVLLARMQNEFNDYIYNFTYPSHWSYDGMGPAYRNINATLNHVNFINGKLQGSPVTDSLLFSSGDEILVAGSQKTADLPGCNDDFSTFPEYNRIWAIDSNVLFSTGKKAFYFIDRAGIPYNGHDVSLKIVRSGRRNIFGSVGSFTSLNNPIVKNTGSGNYELIVNTNTKIVAASTAEFKQFWKVEDIKSKLKNVNCLPQWRPTGIVRCAQSSGVNTGFQEGDEKDINPFSPTRFQHRWANLGLNCAECGRPASWQPTGNLRCVQDSTGANTGFQEREEIDTVTCGDSSGLTRWVNLGKNCAACSMPAKWVSIPDSVRCTKDGSNINTGFRERKEIDTSSCSGTFNQTRWTIFEKNCSSCAVPAKWAAFPDSLRCVKDGSNNNTGYRERKEIDTANCSATYNQTRWNVFERNCTACEAPAKWTPITDSVRCLKDGINNTGYRERKEIDTSSCSSTYNQTRWITFEKNCSSCAAPAKWVPIPDSTRCAIDPKAGAPSGFREQKEIDTASCSSTYNTTRWTITILDCITCAGGIHCPVVCDSSNCNGPGQKCVNGVCETGTKVYTISVYDPFNDVTICVYHYEWSDGSRSGNAFETHPGQGPFCPQTPEP